MSSCFVIQGYGRKTDYRDGRVLDLDASYAIVKDAVEAAGLECIRTELKDVIQAFVAECRTYSPRYASLQRLQAADGRRCSQRRRTGAVRVADGAAARRSAGSRRRWQ